MQHLYRKLLDTAYTKHFSLLLRSFSLLGYTTVTTNKLYLKDLPISVLFISYLVLLKNLQFYCPFHFCKALSMCATQKIYIFSQWLERGRKVLSKTDALSKPSRLYRATNLTTFSWRTFFTVFVSLTQASVKAESPAQSHQRFCTCHHSMMFLFLSLVLLLSSLATTFQCDFLLRSILMHRLKGKWLFNNETKRNCWQTITEEWAVQIHTLAFKGKPKTKQLSFKVCAMRGIFCFPAS